MAGVVVVPAVPVRVRVAVAEAPSVTADVRAAEAAVIVVVMMVIVTMTGRSRRVAPRRDRQSQGNCSKTVVILLHPSGIAEVPHPCWMTRMQGAGQTAETARIPGVFRKVCPVGDATAGRRASESDTSRTSGVDPGCAAPTSRLERISGEKSKAISDRTIWTSAGASMPMARAGSAAEKRDPDAAVDEQGLAGLTGQDKHEDLPGVGAHRPRVFN